MEDHKPYSLTPEVAAIGQIAVTGNITPQSWYKQLTFPSGKSNTIAVILLSEIRYWYTPTEVRDESTGQVTDLKSKFKGEYLQRSAKSFSEQFGFGLRQVQDALKFLEEKGLIKRHLRTINYANGMVASNVLFIQLFPHAIAELQKINSYCARTQDPMRQNAQPHALERGTYTENTTKNSTEIKKVNDVASPRREAAPQSMPSFKKKIENPRDFLKSKEELELFDRLAKFAPQKGEKLLPKEISWWIKEFGTERVKEAVTVYLQQVDRATQGKGNAVVPENAGKYIRNVLNNPTIKPYDENQKANKAFAEDLSKKHPFLSVLEKYVTLPLGIGDIYYTFPHEHFKNLLRQKVETYQQNYC